MKQQLVRLADRIGLSFIDRDPISAKVSSRAARLARGGFVWVAMSGLFALRRSWRRSALAGFVTWAIADGAALGLKRLVGRRRPRFVPGSGPAPRSSAFPSSHAAGAAAYVVAVGLDSPVTIVVTAPLAAAVSWGRLVDRRHFPIDIASGVALGVGVGAAVHFATDSLASHSRLDPSEGTADRRPDAIGRG